MTYANLRPMPHPQVSGQVVGDEAVLVLPEKGKVVVLNEVGGRIWELADGTRTVTDIVEVIVSEYQVSEEQARADVEKFIEELVEAQVLVLSPEE